MYKYYIQFFKRCTSDVKFLFRVAVVAIISLLLSYLLHKKIQSEPSFSNELSGVNPARADTVLKYMNLDDKIKQLIIYETQISDSSEIHELSNFQKEFNPGGILLKPNSLYPDTCFSNYGDDKKFVNPFFIIHENALIKRLSKTHNLPTINHLTNLEDDSLKIKFYAFLAKAGKAMNISGLISDFSVTEEDTTQFDEYFKLKMLFGRTMSKEKLPAILPENQLLPHDSAFQKKNKALLSAYIGIAENSFGNKKKIFDDKDYKFGGLRFSKAAKDSIDLLYEQFMSETDAFITDNPQDTYTELHYLLKENKISENQLNQKVRMVLLLKTYAGIDSLKSYDKQNLDSLVSRDSIKVLIRNVFKNSVCLLKNTNNEIPFKQTYKKKYLIINSSKKETFDNFFETFNYYLKPNIINADKISSKNLKKYSQNYKVILITSSQSDTAALRTVFEQIPKKQISVVNFGTTNNLSLTTNATNFLQITDKKKYDQKYAAEALWGGIPIRGKLPVNPILLTQFSRTYQTSKTRIAKTIPEEVKLNSKTLKNIDSIATSGIIKGAYPGCQVVILKNGYEVFNKAYGYHTYSRKQAVKKTDIYDLASITKVAATTTAFMRMYDHKKVYLDAPLGNYFKDTKIDYSNIKPDTIINIDTLKISEIEDFNKLLKQQDTIHLNDSVLIAYDTLLVRTTPKNNIFKVTMRDLLLHKSGLTPVLPILPYLLYKKYFYDSLEYKKNLYIENAIAAGLSPDSIPKYSVRDSLKLVYNNYFSPRYIKDSAQIRIANGFYFKNNYFDTLWKNTKRLKVYSRKIYQYADINMILLQQAMDTVNRKNLDSYLKQEIFYPMNLMNISFKPYKYFDKNQITPTENDKYWREQLLRGDVHDPSAAMLGGISGNAGLFSNALDLAILGQMWLNKGTYGGMRFISENTINLFTGPQKDSHRGLGFNKASKKGSTAPETPSETFGHTGFTGTCIWVDPVNEIVFVFLSNRVHPNQKNWRIIKYKIRKNMHSAIYKALIKN